MYVNSVLATLLPNMIFPFSAVHYLFPVLLILGHVCCLYYFIEQFKHNVPGRDAFWRLVGPKLPTIAFVLIGYTPAPAPNLVKMKTASGGKRIQILRHQPEERLVIAVWAGDSDTAPGSLQLGSCSGSGALSSQKNCHAEDNDLISDIFRSIPNSPYPPGTCLLEQHNHHDLVVPRHELNVFQ